MGNAFRLQLSTMTAAPGAARAIPGTLRAVKGWTVRPMKPVASATTAKSVWPMRASATASDAPSVANA